MEDIKIFIGPQDGYKKTQMTIALTEDPWYQIREPTFRIEGPQNEKGQKRSTERKKLRNTNLEDVASVYKRVREKVFEEQ